MKKFQTLAMIMLVLICFFFSAQIHAQITKTEKQQTSDAVIKKEIMASLELWNKTAKNSDLVHFMELFDNTPDIMLVGSDSGEVFKGRDQIETWLKMLLAHRSFSWEMSRLDIDHNGNTAWVFMDGSMIVTNDKGNTSKFPYRFTGIMVKIKNSWKWRLFNGSVPGGH
jgi:ketosteroid isomerase-like protein